MALFSWLARGWAARGQPAVPEGKGLEAAPPGPSGKSVRVGPSEPAAKKISEGVVPGSQGIEGSPVARPSGAGRMERGAAGVAGPTLARAPVPEGGAIELPLAKILECIPLLFLAGDAERLVASDAVRDRVVALPLTRVLAQLPSGRVEFPFDELRPQIPAQFLSAEANAQGRGEVLVALDLPEIVSRVPEGKLARRGGQLEAVSRSGGAEILVPVPFPVEASGPLRETERLAKGVSAHSVISAEPAPEKAPPLPERARPVTPARVEGAERPRAPTAKSAAPPPAGAKVAAAATGRARLLPKVRASVQRPRGTEAASGGQAAVSPAPMPQGDAKAVAARALARWLGCSAGRRILIREIPGILSELPGVAGAILSDGEALTVARQLPAGLSDEAVSSSASVLFKRLRHAAKEFGGGFTNQTLVGLGQWTFLITCEPPFFLTTLHASHQVPPRHALRMRKVAQALARLEAAR